MSVKEEKQLERFRFFVGTETCQKELEMLLNLFTTMDILPTTIPIMAQPSLLVTGMTQGDTFVEGDKQRIPLTFRVPDTLAIVPPYVIGYDYSVMEVKNISTITYSLCFFIEYKQKNIWVVYDNGVLRDLNTFKEI